MPVTINFVHVDIRDARELLFESIAIIALAQAIGNRWIRAFLVWCVINWWGHFFLPPKSTAILFNICFAFLLFYLIKTYIPNREIAKIVKFICITAIIQVVWVGVQALNLDLIYHPRDLQGNRMIGYVKSVGSLGNKGHLGAYLAMCLPFFRVYYRKFIPFVIIVLFCTCSALPVVAGLCGLLIFEFFMAEKFKKRQKFVVLFIISVFAAGFFLKFIDGFGTERLIIWKKLVLRSFRYWKALPFLVGEGLGKFQHLKVVEKDISTSVWTNPHNEYLQVYFELGVFGLFFIIGYLLNLFKRFLKVRTELTVALFSSICVVLIFSIGNFPFQIAPLAFLAITCFALLEKCLLPTNVLLKNSRI